nr:MAG TPA: hypothetical protein [Caudoviricetes sp.]
MTTLILLKFISEILKSLLNSNQSLGHKISLLAAVLVSTLTVVAVVRFLGL